MTTKTIPGTDIPSSAPTSGRQPNPSRLPLCQADRVIRRFGNARRLSEALARVGHPRSAPSIYKWLYPKERGGTGGIIPTAAWPGILLAARLFGVLITPEDTDPRELVPQKANRYDEMFD